jgi:hypothetical protein
MVSVPKTANVTEQKETNIPLQALDAIKSEQSSLIQTYAAKLTGRK